jgi:hypothetical protein
LIIAHNNLGKRKFMSELGTTLGVSRVDNHDLSLNTCHNTNLQLQDIAESPVARLQPIYNLLKPLEWSDRTEIQSALSQYPQWTSELTFVNLYAWAPIQYPRWGQVDGHIIVSYDPGNTGESVKFLPPIGPDPKSVMETLHRDYGAVFVRVDKAHLSSIASDVNTELTPKDHDYLYTVDQIRELKGSQASELRRRSNKLIRDQGADLTTASINAETLDDARIVVDKWLKERLDSAKDDSDRSGKIEDATACNRVLERWSELGQLKGTLIYHRGEPVSLGIGELIEHPEATHGILVSHFEKSVISRELQGLTIYSFQVLCSSLDKECVVNRMQSAGNEGLRVWKESWGPFGQREKGAVGLPVNN